MRICVRAPPPLLWHLTAKHFQHQRGELHAVLGLEGERAVLLGVLLVQAAQVGQLLDHFGVEETSAGVVHADVGLQGLRQMVLELLYAAVVLDPGTICCWWVRREQGREYDGYKGDYSAGGGKQAEGERWGAQWKKQRMVRLRQGGGWKERRRAPVKGEFIKKKTLPQKQKTLTTYDPDLWTLFSDDTTCTLLSHHLLTVNTLRTEQWNTLTATTSFFLMWFFLFSQQVSDTK